MGYRDWREDPSNLTARKVAFAAITGIGFGLLSFVLGVSLMASAGIAATMFLLSYIVASIYN